MTLEEKQELSKLYQEGMTTRELCIKFSYGVNNRHPIINALRELNIPIRLDNETHAKRYNIDDTYFERVDTEDKAYFLGLLYADGYNGEEFNAIRLMLAEDDKYILETFKTYLKTTKPLRFYNRSKLNPKWKNCFALDIENKKMSQDLAKLNCVQKKSFIVTFPDFLEERLIHHFVRGYFDGNGCITYNSARKETHTRAISLSIVSTIEFLLDLQKILIKELGFTATKLSKRHRDRKDNIYTLCYGGNIQAMKFKDWLYKDATIYFKRKYDKFY